VSRALLYRVYPDLAPPKGHSGTALYADGVGEDGSQGPGIVGFQSFVQRSGHVQNLKWKVPLSSGGWNWAEWHSLERSKSLLS
jgi:hypothetical protein